MPAVKRKNSKKTKAKQKKHSPIDGLRLFFEQYTKAAGAGIFVIGLVAVMVLWSGGYVGRFMSGVSNAATASAASIGFDIRRITARGLDETDQAELLGAIGPVVGSSMLQFNIHNARARVEELGWVRSAAVQRLWPNGVHVSIRERVPAAVWQMSGAFHLIDANGAVIKDIENDEFSNLPLIVGAGAPDAASEILVALRADPLLWAETLALVRVGGRRWNVRLHKGGDIKFPETGLSRAVRDMARLHEVYGLLDRPIEYVDLRDPNNIVYREKDAERDVLATN